MDQWAFENATNTLRMSKCMLHMRQRLKCQHTDPATTPQPPTDHIAKAVCSMNDESYHHWGSHHGTIVGKMQDKSRMAKGT